MIRVVIIDDHHLTRTGIRRLLQDAENIQVIGEAGCGEEGVKLVQEAQPDVVLLDIFLPDVHGIKVLSQIKRIIPTVKVMVISNNSRDFIKKQVFLAGASGYLEKSASQNDLISMIEKIYSGVEQTKVKSKPERKMELPQLSVQELEVFFMIVNGRSVFEIAKKLKVECQTVHTYRKRLFRKLDVSSDVELLWIAIEHGLLELDFY